MTTTAPPPVHRPLAVGWGPRRLQHPKIAAGTAAVVALFVTPAGAGVGIRYLTKTGLTGTSVLGLAVFGIGLALFVYAVRVVWGTWCRWQRLLLLPLALVALLVMWPVAEGTMLAKAPRNDLGSTTPAARGLAYSNVTFRTSDGVRLSAWLVPSRNKAAIVTVPGSGSNRTATVGQASVLARHGYGVLLLDPRGQGRSGGHAMDAGWYGERDLAAAVAFLQQQAGIDPQRIGVLGLSMGGEEAIGAAGVVPAIRAVVAEGATHRTAADKAGYLPGGVAGEIQRRMDVLTYGVAALLSSAPRPATLYSSIVRAKATPFLLIGASKGLDEPEAIAYLRGAAPDRVQTWIVRGATHTHGLTTAPDEWTANVTTFFDRALDVTVGSK